MSWHGRKQRTFDVHPGMSNHTCATLLGEASRQTAVRMPQRRCIMTCSRTSPTLRQAAAWVQLVKFQTAQDQLRLAACCSTQIAYILVASSPCLLPKQQGVC